MSSQQFYGVTRFSTFVPGSGAWALSREHSEAEYRERLFSPERMQPRCDIFIERALPIYQQWADRHRYRHIVHYTATLPVEYQDRLRAAAEQYPVVLLDRVETKPEATLLMRADLERNHPEAETVTWFRVDDDDLLAVDYMDHLAEVATPAHWKRVASWGLGVAGMYRDGEFVDFRRRRLRTPALGLAYIGRPQGPGRPLIMPKATSHTAQDSTADVIEDGRRIMWIYTQHDQQDQQIGKPPLEERVRQHAPLESLAELHRLFPTIRNPVRAV